MTKAFPPDKVWSFSQSAKLPMRQSYANLAFWGLILGIYMKIYKNGQYRGNFPAVLPIFRFRHVRIDSSFFRQSGLYAKQEPRNPGKSPKLHGFLLI